MKIVIQILFLIVAIAKQPALSQKLFAEIDLTHNTIDDLKGMAIGDSIFISFKEKDYQDTKKERNAWLFNDGTMQELRIPELKNKILCGVANGGTHYYFFEESKKKAVIKCVVVNPLTQEQTLLPDEIEIPGKILGSYLEKDLFLIWIEKGNYDLKLVRINNMRIINQQTFSLTTELIKNNKSNVAFIQSEKNIQPAQAASKIKIIKRSNEIFIVVDETYQDYDPEGKTYKTSVTRLDLNSEKVTTNSYFESARSIFTSTVFDHYVVRHSSEKGLQIFDFNTNSLVHEVPFSNTYERGVLYSRNSSKKTITAKELKNFKLFVNLICVDSTDAGNVVFTLGNYFIDKPDLYFINATPFLFLLSGLTTVAVRSLSEGSGVASYLYFKGTLTSNISPDNDVKLLRKKIDDYELDLQSKGTKFKYKGYMNVAKTTYAFYQEVIVKN